MKLSSEDLYQLRKARLLAEKRALAAQQAEQGYQELLLEMEQRYGVLGKPTRIDLSLGEIMEETAGNSRDGGKVDRLEGLRIEAAPVRSD